MHLHAWQWALAGLAALGIGLSKTGIPGLGILAVALFALVMPARQSVGVVLPILICADIVAVTVYRRHAVWPHLWRLFPWGAVGVVLGWQALGRIGDAQMAKLIGVILLGLVAVQLWRRRAGRPEPKDSMTPRHPLLSQEAWLAAGMGMLAGFTTMVANAAGPIMVLYLLAARLPKMEFIGTGAWYFLVVNLFKVPFSCRLGLINAESLPVDLALAPLAVAGAVCGRFILRLINQGLFEIIALALTLLAGLRLLL